MKRDGSLEHGSDGGGPRASFSGVSAAHRRIIALMFAEVKWRLGRRPLGADALQQRGGRLVAGVLGDELPRERFFQYALAQPPGPCEVGLDRGLGPVG